MIEYLIDRMELAGADRIRVSVRPEKRDVTEIARRRGAEIVFGHPATATASLASAADGLADADIALFGFPDTIWSPRDGFVSLRAAVATGEEMALGIFASPYPERSDVAHLGDDGRVVRIEVNPAMPTTNLVWACGAASVRQLRELTATTEIGEAVRRAVTDKPRAAVLLGRVIDVGTPQALAAAEVDPVFDEA